MEYHKIHSLFNRDKTTFKFIEGDYGLPEFEYLKDNAWIFTEKIDGTNIRIGWDGSRVFIGGRTDRAQIPALLLKRLQEILPAEELAKTFPDIPDSFYTSVFLYGEGFGAGIQKGGGKYLPDSVDFILFDVLVGKWWLNREGVESIAKALNVRVVPVRLIGKLSEGVSMIKTGMVSRFGNFEAEGLVARPQIELKTRSGARIITKIKHTDF